MQVAIRNSCKTGWGWIWFTSLKVKGIDSLRMARSLRNAFLSEAEKVIIIGTDCPGVNAQILATVFEKLPTFDLVLSPAINRGYYLIGLRQPIPELFVNSEWGTA